MTEIVNGDDSSDEVPDLEVAEAPTVDVTPDDDYGEEQVVVNKLFAPPADQQPGKVFLTDAGFTTGNVDDLMHNV